MDEFQKNFSSFSTGWLMDSLLQKSHLDKQSPKKPEQPRLTLEEVRAILAEKSRAGFTAQIQQLLEKYSASKLSKIDPAHYRALVNDAEGLK